MAPNAAAAGERVVHEDGTNLNEWKDMKKCRLFPQNSLWEN
jgi:hypothetical protein